MITIKEMANMLGMSTTTVSNVIHGKTKEVSPETIKKVEALLEEYDYIPNINARNLASNKSGIIGVGMLRSAREQMNFLQDAFIGELVGSIEQALKSTNYHLMLYFSSTEDELVKNASSWNADGLILFGVTRDSFLAIQKRYRKPMVFVDSHINDLNLVGVNIGLDDVRGGNLMGEHLLSMGHTKIAYLADAYGGCDFERFTGMASALQAKGVPVRTDDFIVINPTNRPIEDCMIDIIDKLKQYTAVFCSSDYYALLLMNILRDRGIRVPEDISIAGFDDNIYSKMARPAITTIHQDPSEKGRLAVSYLLDLIEGKKIPNNWVLLPVHLVERDTVKNLNS